jgi:hypothetical protein
MSAKAPSTVVGNVTHKYIFVQEEVETPTRGVFEETRNGMRCVIQEGGGVLGQVGQDVCCFGYFICM